MLCFLLGPSLSQDTAYQDTLPKQTHGHHVKATLARMEQRLTHQIHESERRMLWKLQDKVKKLNFSDEIDWLEGIFEFHEKEFEMLQEYQNKQSRIIEDLRQKVSRDEDLIVRQNRQMSRLRGDMEQMNTMVANLTSMVETLLHVTPSGALPHQQQTTKPTTSSSSLPAIGTASPAKPGKHYPAGKHCNYM